MVTVVYLRAQISIMYSALYSILLLLTGYIVFEIVWLTYCGLVAKYLATVAVPFNETTAVCPSTIIAGDSFILGVGVTDPSNSLGGRIAHYFGSTDTVVRAKPGIMLESVVTLLDPTDKCTEWARCILFCGGMDIISFSSEEKIKHDIRVLFRAAKKNSKMVIYISPGNTGIVPIFHFPISKLYTYRSRRFHAIAKQVADEENIIFINTFTEEKDRLFKSKKNLYAADSNHYNDAGYGVMFESIRERIEETRHLNGVS